MSTRTTQLADELRSLIKDGRHAARVAKERGLFHLRREATRLALDYRHTLRLLQS